MDGRHRQHRGMAARARLRRMGLTVLLALLPWQIMASGTSRHEPRVAHAAVVQDGGTTEERTLCGYPARPLAEAIDRSFGENGLLRPPTAGFARAEPALVDHRGRLTAVVAQTADLVQGTTRLDLVRWDTAGQVDPTFGEGGRLTVHLPIPVSLGSVAVTPDGVITLAGAIRGAPFDPQTEAVVLAFDEQGHERYTAINRFPGVSSADAFSLGVWADGSAAVLVRIGILEPGQPGADFTYALWTLTADGRTISSLPLASAGLPFTLAFYYDHNLAALADNTLLLVGMAVSLPAAMSPAQGYVAIALLNYSKEGTLVSSFGSGGAVLMRYPAQPAPPDFAPPPQDAFTAAPVGLAVRSDGSLVIIGQRAPFITNAASLGGKASRGLFVVLLDVQGRPLVAPERGGVVDVPLPGCSIGLLNRVVAGPDGGALTVVRLVEGEDEPQHTDASVLLVLAISPSPEVAVTGLTHRYVASPVYAASDPLAAVVGVAVGESGGPVLAFNRRITVEVGFEPSPFYSFIRLYPPTGGTTP